MKRPSYNYRVILIFLAITSSSIAQVPKDTISLTKILISAASYEDSTLVYDGYFIKQLPRQIRNGQYVSHLDITLEDLKNNPGNYSNTIELDSADHLILKSAITIKNFQSKDFLVFNELIFRKKVVVVIGKEEGLLVRKCDFGDDLFLMLNQKSRLIINESSINKFDLERASEVGESYVSIEGCTFNSVTKDSWYSQDKSIDTIRNVFLERGVLENDIDTLKLKSEISLAVYGDLILENNVFDEGVKLSTIYGEIRNLAIEDNKINGLLLLNVEVSKRITIQRNKGDFYLELKDLKIDEANQEIDYDQISSFKLIDRFPLMDVVYVKNGLPLDKEALYGIFDGTFYHPLFQVEYDRLMSVYRKLYQGFRNNGNERYANGLYVELKDIETTRLEYLSNNKGTFKNWTKWRLNQLLRIYTVYGTDPSGAIVGSFYIVILFGIFYFFYPSEWDSKSKGQLIQDFKILVQKNEHGYFKPFLSLMKGLVISLINALTLSLNAFVTLGFGSIPTTGLARYVCVIQGFIGWFLLSIFTVALINQVLF